MIGSLTRNGKFGWSQKRRSGATNNALVQAELAALGIDADDITTVADVTDFIDRFVAIIEDPLSVSATTLRYLATDSFAAGTSLPLHAGHMLYWADRLVKQNKVGIGYTDRLSEADEVTETWGAVTPDNLADADPFDLVTTLEGLGCNVAIIDPEAVDDATAGSEDGPVLITDSSRNCTLLDATTAKSFDSSADLFKTVSATRDAYRYRLWGLKTAVNGNDTVGGFGNLHEGGGGVHRFPNSTKPCIILTRHGDDHQVAKERIWRNPSLAEPAYILLSGYPGEFPTIRMGSSVVGSAPQTLDNGPQIYWGFSTTGRSNTHLRNLDLVGNRDGEYDDGGGNVTGKVYAKTMFLVQSSSTNCSVRHCRVRDFLPMTPSHSEAASYADYVDIIYPDRPASNGDDPSFEAFFVKGSDFTFDSNHVQAADLGIASFEEYGSTYPISRGTDVQAHNARITRNTYDGFCSGDYCRVTPRPGAENITGYYCADNVIVSNGYKCLLAQSSSSVSTHSISGIIERNFVYNAGTEDRQNAGGDLASLFPGAGTLIVRDNVFANNIDGQVQRDQMTAGAVGIGMADATGDGDIDSGNGTAIGGTQFYNNILWNTVLRFSSDVAGYANAQTIVASHEVYKNLIHGPPDPLKSENRTSPSDLLDAPVMFNIYAGTTLGNTTFTDNNVTRDAGDDNETVLLAHRDGASSVTQYEVADTQMTGVSGLTSSDPQYADPANGDFTSGNATLAAYVASAPKTRAAVRAWTP